MASDSNRSLRLLLIATVVALVNILSWHSSIERGNYAGDVSQLPDNSTLASHYGYRSGGLHSGVGLVTQDGMWGNEFDEKYKYEDIKILGFTDKNYLPIAKYWYMRLTALGHKEHYIVAHDEISYNALKDEYRAIPCIIQNPDYARPVKGLWQQIMSARLHLTVDMLRNGTHLLITDVDNVFSRYVPLSGFLEEGYDVYHAFEMRYPVNIFNQFGFVVCSGHQFLRSTPATLRFMDLVMNRCNREKCDDQVTYNYVFFLDLDIQWDGMETPNNTHALRVNISEGENSKLLVESVTGRSNVTGHTIKIWDRDFAWRLAGALPEFCPSSNNWLGMPTKLPVEMTGGGNKVHTKIAGFEVWDQQCLQKAT
mmetsp:Transcript_34780/g.83168  ORF Transcript_34780/g.83168 Transcript_34780/m.83168 type:complete len:367 (-) Transcript_34780:254-1354(-)